MSGLDWGRLLRLSLAPTALADVLAGLVVGGHGALPSAREVGCLGLASLAVYHGAMVLNDWSDRARDARTRPERPIPSGAISSRAAAVVGFGLVALGVASASFVAPRAGAWMATVAGLAVVYDLWGRGAWRGPLLLGLCRAGNLGLGMFYAGWLASAPSAPNASVPRWAWLLCALYGAYVFFASRVGRLEDDEDPRALGMRPTAYLAAASCVLLALPWLDPDATPGASSPVAFHPLALACAWLGALGLARVAFTTREWTRALVGRSMGLALRRLLVFTASCALLSAGPSTSACVVALAILAGYPISFALRGVFPPS